jgi:hypothetical protein
MRSIATLILTFALLCISNTKAHAQDSTREVKVFDRTLLIPEDMQMVLDDKTVCRKGYFTDGIDTLYFDRCMAIAPMNKEMMYYMCPEFDSSECAKENARIRRYNDSLRAEDPRIGTYKNTFFNADGCYFEFYIPNPGIDGTLSLEIMSTVPRHVSFVLTTTVIDAEKQGKWRAILESVR